MKKENKIQGFTAPDDYFENFEDRLFLNIAVEDFPKSSGFKVPDNYFTELENRMLAVVETPKTSVRVISLFSKRYIGVAAAIAAFLILGITVFKSPNISSNIDSLQLATIDKYIDAGNLNLDLYELTSYINDEDISNIDLQGQQMEDTDIEAYLFENTNEETTIYEP